MLRMERQPVEKKNGGSSSKIENSKSFFFFKSIEPKSQSIKFEVIDKRKIIIVTNEGEETDKTLLLRADFTSLFFGELHIFSLLQTGVD